MTAILIIIGLILLFKFVLTSHAAANLPQGTSTVNTASCGSAGDNFTSGSGIVPGVSEPTTPLACNKAQLLRCDAPPASFNPPPLHITYPVQPPPIKVQNPILVRKPITASCYPAPPVVRPIIQPRVYTNTAPVNPIAKTFPMQDPFRFSCNYYGGGETFSAGCNIAP